MKKRLATVCILLLFALVASALGGAIADNNTAMNNTMSWDGLYATNVKETSGQWAMPGTLLVSWGKEVSYEGTPISRAEFFNNSSISWTQDAKWGSGRIWFTYGDNRSQYWPDGPAKGRVFAGWIKVGSTAPADWRGINESIKCNDRCIKNAECCSGCPYWKICDNARCVCPPGIKNCPDQLPM